jgi:hypothetical protein
MATATCPSPNLTFNIFRHGTVTKAELEALSAIE